MLQLKKKEVYYIREHPERDIAGIRIIDFLENLEASVMLKKRYRDGKIDIYRWKFSQNTYLQMGTDFDDTNHTFPYTVGRNTMFDESRNNFRINIIS